MIWLGVLAESMKRSMEPWKWPMPVPMPVPIEEGERCWRTNCVNKATSATGLCSRCVYELRSWSAV